ncbi:sugar-binding protein [Paraflavitalea speifideaquila]|uniref:sugar-binding protein n=1 Tax=Paraflavitalea speifideaquila TaxID=3076558 RepID=UPI0028E66065|nr:sugar-binding protein [Paraflavitalea speifideiaquila]
MTWSAPKPFFKLVGLFAGCLLFSQLLLAHNGKVAYAYLLRTIKVDGDLSDWPSTAVKYAMQRLSEKSPVNAGDFSGFFQVGYRAVNRSLYLAFTVTDDEFLEDTSQNARWNTQDGLELSIDARHLPGRSG